MIGFYKENIDYLTENAVNPDKRRYAVKDEAPRHYIDLDVYYDSTQQKLINTYWNQALEVLPEDTLLAYGTVPWHVYLMKVRLTKAFQERNTKEILRLSAEIGHYIGDAHVPLHTSENYNGQLSNQVGIHGFWESRLPELFADDYSFWLGRATYVQHPQKRIWEVVMQSHAALDSVLSFEKQLTLEFDEDKKFTIEERNGITVRNYSRPFSAKYHEMLDDQVQKRMRASVKTVADYWFTAWVDAGQPNLDKLGKYIPNAEDLADDVAQKKAWLQRIINVRKEADE